jgi:hypothetical protein
MHDWDLNLSRPSTTKKENHIKSCMVGVVGGWLAGVHGVFHPRLLDVFRMSGWWWWRSFFMVLGC